VSSSLVPLSSSSTLESSGGVSHDAASIGELVNRNRWNVSRTADERASGRAAVGPPEQLFAPVDDVVKRRKREHSTVGLLLAVGEQVTSNATGNVTLGRRVCEPLASLLSVVAPVSLCLSVSLSVSLGSAHLARKSSAADCDMIVYLERTARSIYSAKHTKPMKYTDEKRDDKKTNGPSEISRSMSSRCQSVFSKRDEDESVCVRSKTTDELRRPLTERRHATRVLSANRLFVLRLCSLMRSVVLSASRLSSMRWRAARVNSCSAHSHFPCLVENDEHDKHDERDEPNDDVRPETDSCRPSTSSY
jgi:hypothetical protein